MADTPSKNSKEPVAETENPEPEELQPRTDDASAESESQKATPPKEKAKSKGKKGKRLPTRSRYHLSHKATFIGLAVVAAVLAVNAVIITFVIGNSPGDEDEAHDQVLVSGEALEGLGVNRTTLDDDGVELIVGPSASFESGVQVAGGMNVAGEVILNDNLSAIEASMDSLQAGEATIEQLNVSNDGTLTNMNVREDLAVAGTSRLQGPVTVSGLFTVENNTNIAGNLTVGGAISVNAFSVNNLSINGRTVLGGHVLTRGSAPSASAGPAAGSNGTVSISGNDTSGTVGFNAGVGAGNGIVARVNFANGYSSTPTVVITPVGDVGDFYVSRSSSGFNIGVGNSVSPGGYAFDYIIMQ